MNQNVVAHFLILPLPSLLNYHPQSSFWLILSWMDCSIYPPESTRIIRYLPFKHNIPQTVWHSNATTNVPSMYYIGVPFKPTSESTFCVVCCLVPVLIMLHSLDLLWALDEANYVSTSVWGEVEQHHEAHQVPYLTPKKVALVFFLKLDRSYFLRYKAEIVDAHRYCYRDSCSLYPYFS